MTRWKSLLVALFLLGGCASYTENSVQQENKQVEDITGANEQTETTKENEDSSPAVNPEEEKQVSPGSIQGKVVYVVDGDTFDIQLENGKKERVRMTLVDTPETKHPRLGVQPFGPEASSFTKNKLTGKDVSLELDVQERDQYGRILAYVWIGDELYNRTLIEKGLARVAVFPPNTRYVDDFQEVQNQAQKKKAGIWSIEDYVTDRGYNGQVKEETPSKKEDGCTIKGNISSSGEKIYHVPGGQFYEVTKPEEIFCSKEEAEAAGYRVSQR
ncbi:MAG TPA: thermonuclease family protein [Chondromyces sp.]|nr:thermonuclease family protein [Chondromyces sp.]